MKKNKTLRLAAALLILVLLTTGIISGTFAKYVTQGKASDTARVAKWGVTVTTSGSLYSNAYAAKADTSSSSNLPTEWHADSISGKTVTVATKTDTDDNIVAPGTKSYGDGLSFGITGEPEVAVKVGITVSAEDIFLAQGTYGVLVPVTVSDGANFAEVFAANTNGVYKEQSLGSVYTKVANADNYAAGNSYYILTSKAEVTGADYYPVKYKLGSDTGLKAADVADKLAEKIQGSVIETPATATAYNVTYENIENTYAANTNLATKLALTNQKISWEWPYQVEKTENGNTVVDTNIDACDTVLGDLIAARGATVDYKVVSVATDGTVTALTIETGDNDYTVKKGNDVVANLRTTVDISLTVTQVD